VIPRDQLGIMTMDFVTKELLPGESLQFDFNVRAIEPNDNFDMYTHQLFMEEDIYIIDLEWPDLQERHPDLTAVAPGSYPVGVYFIYAIADENDPMSAFGAPTGYAAAEILVGIS
jgi:hypothetical protein